MTLVQVVNIQRRGRIASLRPERKSMQLLIVHFGHFHIIDGEILVHIVRQEIWQLFLDRLNEFLYVHHPFSSFPSSTV